MRTVGIRQITSSSVRDAARQGEVLGVTSGRVPVAVLVPIDSDVLEEISNRKSRPADPGRTPGVSRGLDDLLKTSSTPSRRELLRVPIRGLSGSRISQAANTRDILVVTDRGIAVAYLLPVTTESSSWISLLGQADGPLSINEFLDRWLAGTEEESIFPAFGQRRTATVAPPAPGVLGTHSNFDLARRRAIGIKISPHRESEGDKRTHLAAVTTDFLSNPIGTSVELELKSTDPALVVGEVVRLVSSLREAIDPHFYLHGIGISVAGHVREGTIVYSPDADWNDFAIGMLLGEELQRIGVDAPIIVENDANALAVRELRLHGIADDNMAVILIAERGIGSGLVINGRLVRGVSGIAGEIGHIPIECDLKGAPIKCRCGNPDCLEMATAPHHIVEQVANEHHGFSGDLNDATELIAAGVNGPVAAVFRRAGEALGRAIASVINLLNPSVIIFHGPASLLGDPREFRGSDTASGLGAASLYIQSMTERINSHSYSSGANECRFVVRATDQIAGAAAAAACALSEARKWPELQGLTQ